MKTFKEWFEANYPEEKYPEGSINGNWFYSHDLPMVIQCTNCGMTMALPSALVNKEGNCYCSECAK